MIYTPPGYVYSDTMQTLFLTVYVFSLTVAVAVVAMKTVNYEPEDSIQLYSCMIYIGNNYCYNTDSVHNLVYNIIIALVIATTYLSRLNF